MRNFTISELLLSHPATSRRASVLCFSHHSAYADWYSAMGKLLMTKYAYSLGASYVLLNCYDRLPNRDYQPLLKMARFIASAPLSLVICCTDMPSMVTESVPCHWLIVIKLKGFFQEHNSAEEDTSHQHWRSTCRHMVP